MSSKLSLVMACSTVSNAARAFAEAAGSSVRFKLTVSVASPAAVSVISMLPFKVAGPMLRSVGEIFNKLSMPRSQITKLSSLGRVPCCFSSATTV